MPTLRLILPLQHLSFFVLAFRGFRLSCLVQCMGQDCSLDNPFLGVTTFIGILDGVLP